MPCILDNRYLLNLYILALHFSPVTIGMTDFIPLYLRRNEERRIRSGHPWVFSNEIDVAKSPVKGLEPGVPVEVLDYRGKSLGTGYANPASLICARIVSRDKKHPFSGSLLVHKLKVALSLRQRLYEKPFYRWVYGESDGLPGLVIDRFDQIVVVQITTAGMDVMQQEIVDAIEKVVHPEVIYLRNDSSMRKLEGLSTDSIIAKGELPDRIQVTEADCQFEAPLKDGQKTGWFYDQRDNRERLARYAKGARVLDVFSYVGGWGVRSAAAGAESVVCVDESKKATDFVSSNAALNGLSDKVDTVTGDAFDVLREMRAEKRQFDTIIVDPPAFIKRKKDAKKGIEAYRRINQMALQLLSRDGFLISCSCSHHLRDGLLEQNVYQAARHLDREVQILERGGQSSDHPVHPAIPETQYLKAIYFRQTRG